MIRPGQTRTNRRIIFARAIFAVLLVLAAAPVARPEYVLLRNGQRLRITGYERDGATVRLQIPGGRVIVPAEEIVAIEPEDRFPALARPETLKVPYSDLIRAAALKHGVDQELIASVIAVESNFDPRAVSRKDARGLMQLLPQVCVQYQVTDVFDPQQNIDAGTRYLKDLLALYHQDIALTLAAYNAGPDRVGQYRGVPPFRETQHYIRRVAENVRKHKAKTPAPQLAELPAGTRPAQ